MRHRLLFLLKYYFFFVLVFVLQKPLFMWFHSGNFGAGLTAGDWFAVMQHGLPLDFSMSGYICILPFLAVVASVWLKPQLTKKIIDIYTGVIVLVATIIFSVDLDLYAYWNFRLDDTPLAFLKTPKDAAASFSAILVLRQIAIMIACFSVLFLSYKRVISKTIDKFPAMNWAYSTVLLLLSACLFLPIRGGVSDAVMNVGWVYFSDNMFLNHAAINPFWNFLNSLVRSDDFEGQYQFFSGEEAEGRFHSLYQTTDKHSETQYVLDKPKPNIIVVILESFSAGVIGSLGGESDVTPNLNRLSKEGILFNNFYATSFRTDRGVSAILSGYPSQPRSCIMKYPAKTGALPNLGKTLKKEGYDLSFYYGGNENFTNMRSYLINGGFQRIISSKDFSRKDYAGRWGAADEAVFSRMLTDLNQRTDTTPFFNVLLTLSSHEPFIVPMKTRFEGDAKDDLYRNVVYYTDSCIGDFIAKAKRQAWWDNTVVVFISDHSFGYPEGLPMHVPERYHIIMLWLGGALTAPMTVDKIGYQPDFVNTVLSQLRLNDNEYRFGKNLLNPNARGFACYTYNHGIGFVDEEGFCSLDLNTNKPILGDDCDIAKAFLQYTFEDFVKR